jgi:hypothetical protein
MFGAILPSPWYGTCSMTVSPPYLWRMSSNHFMKVKQPVYESRRRSGRGSASPVGPISPPCIMPRSALTYVHTSSDWPSRSASMMNLPDFLRRPFCSALVSGRLRAKSKHIKSSLRFPGTKVADTLRPVCRAVASSG